MTINPAVSTENNTAWLSLASAIAVSPAAAAKMAQIEHMTRIAAGVVMLAPYSVHICRPDKAAFWGRDLSGKDLPGIDAQALNEAGEERIGVVGNYHMREEKWWAVVYER